MKTFSLSCLALILVVTGVGAFAQDDGATVPDVEKLMSKEDFEASGLDKLTDAERAHFNEWLEHYRQGAEKGPVVAKPPSQWTEEQKQAEKNFRIDAKVIPSFRGWTGKTVFRLDNGQTWQQRMPGKFYYNGSSAEVTITRNFMGRHVLEHVETDRSVLVKRVD